MTRKIQKSALEEHQQNYVGWLEKEGHVFVNDSNIIEICDPLLLHIACKLKNSSITYLRQPDYLKAKIDQLSKEDKVAFSANLFTDEEVRYFNYYLNKKEFTNGRDLRNKYLHGTNNQSIEIQQNDYRAFLRVVILVLLKLKDDLELHAALTS